MNFLLCNAQTCPRVFIRKNSRSIPHLYVCVIFVSLGYACVLCSVGVQSTVNPYFTRIVKEVKHMSVQ